MTAKHIDLTRLRDLQNQRRRAMIKRHQYEREEANCEELLQQELDRIELEILEERATSLQKTE